ncbi:MAG: hypothetical protein JOS17DRAFT_692052, partial [Linnemannia elongata]
MTRADTKISLRKSKKDSRRVFVNIPPPAQYLDKNGLPKLSFGSNRINTAKYTTLTFLPKNLFEQFRRVANMFFLFMAIIQLTPTFTVGSPFLTVFPLCFVVGVTAIKDGFEDYKRHVEDRNFNQRLCQQLKNVVNYNYPTADYMAVQKNKSLPARAWGGLVRGVSDTTMATLRALKLSKKTPPQGNLPQLDLNQLAAADIDPSNLQQQPQNDAANNISTGPQPEFIKEQWHNLRVGDFIMLKNNQAVPADAIILSTSEAEGSCFIETKDLDGETNLKTRMSLHETSKYNTARRCSRLKFYVDMEPINANLFTFNGSLTMLAKKRGSGAETTIPVDINNMLLRGHVIRNTHWVIAVIVATGTETKIMLNSGETPSKRSRIEKTMNVQVAINFGILLLLCVVCAVGSTIYDRKWRGTGAEQLWDQSTRGVTINGVITFFTSLIIFQNIIPISLYISIEFVKTFQAYFIWQDSDMYDIELDQFCTPKTWNLTDDLGQIEYVFSDKTGTLTRNIMEFKKCSINGKIYGNNAVSGQTDAEKGLALMGGQDPSQERGGETGGQQQQQEQDSGNEGDKQAVLKEYDQEVRKIFEPAYMDALEILTFADPDIIRDLTGHGAENRTQHDGSPSSNIHDFFTLLALCHTVVEEKPRPTIKYRAESPDEAALVSAAKNVGFAFVSRGAAPSADGGDQKAAKGNSRQNVNLNILGQDHTYEQLDVIKFNSTRKRMTVIVREPQELGGKILLLTKGADNVIFERLAHTDDETLRDQTENDIEAFSNMGLRTLTLAQRVLDQETYDQWAAKYAEAGKALDDRAKKMDQVAEEIERDLTLLGATAIEDKLQEGVPDSIAALREAGIKVWVLTGDKLETAINIGFASRLLEKDMKLEIMKMGRNEDPTRVLARFKELHLPPTPAGTSLIDHEQVQQEQQTSGQGEHALIVDGSALKILLDDPEARQDLIKLSDVCFSVICCRASPLQKALVVELIRRGKKTVCLAIGDGANDVSMIQAANIGVGISGQEGMQAAMASDYSITQFRFVRKLVLVHGHWGYMRIAEMILNFFFKNVLWVAAVLWFQIYCGFSAMLFYDYTFVSLYNFMLTAVPVLVLGATDQDLTAPYVLRYPGVYKLGIQQKRYNQARFIFYMLDGVWQSLVVFWFWRGVYGLNVLGTKGFDNSLLEFSTSVAITNVVIASLYVGLHSYHWTWLTHFAVWGSITFLVLLVVLYGFIQSSPIYHVAIHLFTYGPFWFMLILSVVTALLAKFTILFVSFWWFPDDVHVVRSI